MTRDEIKAAFLEEVNRIAPDIDPADVGDDDHLQDDLELDSMDILNLITALAKRFGIDIPDSETEGIATPALAADYIAGKLG